MSALDAAISREAPAAAATVRCPACGGENPMEAIFCGNERCHKALGEFRYVAEELRAQAHWHETLAENVTTFVGKPHFLVAQVFWLVLWIGVNSGIVVSIHRFDDYPFSLLGLLLAVEAIFLSGFVLISQKRQNAYDTKRAELDYEVNVRTFRKIHEIDALLQEIRTRLDSLEASGKSAAGVTEKRSTP